MMETRLILGAGISALSIALCAPMTFAQDCDVTPPAGAIEADDGCDHGTEVDANGGCNEDPVAWQDLGSLTEADNNVAVYGTVGGWITPADTESRDLDWFTFTVDGPVTLSVTFDTASVTDGLPMADFLWFVTNSDCSDLVVIASGVNTNQECPQSIDPVVLPAAGTYGLVVTVNCFGTADCTPCPSDYLARIVAEYSEFPDCGDPGAGSCVESNGSPGCDDFSCCEAVCNFDPICCEFEWDDTCVNNAVDLCGFFIYDCPDDPAAPSNDCPSGAIAVGDNEVLSFDTELANTVGPDEAACASGENDLPIWRDLWYSWTASDEGTMTASTCGIAQFDTKIAAYDVTDLVDFGELPQFIITCNEDCVDDPEFFSSELTIPVEAGRSYLFRLGGYLDAFGSGDISFNYAPPVQPDECDEPGSAFATNNDSTDLTLNGIACAGAGITVNNEYATIIDLSGLGEVEIRCVEFGWFNTGSSLVGNINIYKDLDGGDPISPDTDLELAATDEILLPATDGVEVVNIAKFDPYVCLQPEADGSLFIVVELAIPASSDGFATFAGNDVGAAYETYLKSAPCGLTEYLKLADIGFPGFYWVVQVNYEAGCGGGDTCVGDINENGVVDGEDLGIMLGQWNATGSNPADLNGDDIVDGEDLGLLLGNWGPCV